MAKVNQNIIKAQDREEHTSELQSHSDLVCRLLLEKKKKKHLLPRVSGTSLFAFKYVQCIYIFSLIAR